MAKNKIEIDVKVDDKGTTKKVGLEAKKTGENLDKTAKGARNADRNLKGAAQASANTTKNFSKMAQGMGGLIAGYAQLAATIFAASAVFRFFQEAGNLKALEQGQLAYASSTGIAMRSLTEDIQAATGAQLTFKEASQSAAIGIAAGLTQDQLVRLGKAAKDSSQILGRDLTDSFNRLIRGATKAEPELLDELGIILRLDTATKNYKKAMGGLERELTAFERTQAVVNDVLEQAEDKFGRIQEAVQVAPNAFNQLAVSFDKMLLQIKDSLLPIGEAIASVLINTPQVAFAALGLVMVNVLNAALPNLATLGQAAKDNTDKLRQGHDSAKASLDNYIKSLKKAKSEIRTTQAGPLQTGTGIVKDLEAKKGSGLETLQKGIKPTTRQLAGMERAIKNNTGAYKNLDAAQRKALLGAVQNLKKTDLEIKKVTFSAKAAGKTIQIAFTTGFAAARTAAMGFAASVTAGIAAIGTALTIMLSVVSWVTLAATLGMVAYEFFRTKEEVDKQAVASEYLAKKLATLKEEYKDLAAIQKILNEKHTRSTQTLIAIGNAIGSLTLGQLTEITDLASKSFDDFSKAMGAARLEVDELQKGLNSLYTDGNIDKISSEFSTWETKIIGAIGLVQKIPIYFAVDIVFNKALGTSPLDAIKSFLQKRAGAKLEEELTRQMEAAGGSLKTYAKTIADESPALLDFIEGSENIIKAFEAQTDPIVRSDKNISGYISTLKAVTGFQWDSTKSVEENQAAFEALRQELLKQKPLAANQVALYQNLDRAIKDNTNATQDLLKTGVEINKFYEQSSALRAELALQVQAAETNAALAASDAHKKRVNELRLEIELFDRLGEAKHRNTLEDIQLSKARNVEDSKFMFKFQRDNLKVERQIYDINTKIARKKEEISLETERYNKEVSKTRNIEAISDNDKLERLSGLAEAHRRNKEILQEETFELQSQIDLIKEQNTAIYELKSAAGSALETSLAGNIADLIKGKITSLKEAVANVILSVLDSIANTMAQQFTEGLLSALGFQTQAMKIQAAHEVGGLKVKTEIVSGGNTAAAAIKTAMVQAGAEVASKLQCSCGPEVEKPASKLEEIVVTAKKLPTPESNVLQEIDMSTIPKKISTDKPIVSDKLDAHVRASSLLYDKGEGTKGLGTLFEGFTDKLKGIFSSDNPLLQGFSSLFGGLGNMFSSLFSSLGSLFGGSGTGILSIIGGFFGLPFANGGYAPGGFRAFADGGLVTKPTLGLVGEGSMNEAIVPLPNGRSIPVDIKGSGQNNNVVVNVSVDNQGNGQTSTESQSGADAGLLGQAIAKAVQQELQNQKRSGGILNPYGVA